jgi:hypothetical protein
VKSPLSLPHVSALSLISSFPFYVIRAIDKITLSLTQTAQGIGALGFF